MQVIQKISGGCQVYDWVNQDDEPLHLVVTSKEELVGDVILSGNPGCSDNEIVSFKGLRGLRKARSRVQSLDFWQADLSLFRKVGGGIPWETALRGEDAQESYQVSKQRCR